MLWRGSVELASLPSVFARLASLLAPHAEPNPVVRWTRWVGGGSGKEGGARQGHLGIPSATRLWLRLFRSGSLQRAITDDRPWWQGQEAPQTSRMTWRPANNRMLLEMMSSITWLSPKRWREEGTEGGWRPKIGFVYAGLQGSCWLFINVCTDMVVDVESEQQGHNKHSWKWKYYICPLLTLNLIKWYESVGSLSLKSAGKCKCGTQTEKPHDWSRPIFSSLLKNGIVRYDKVK